MKKEKLHLPFRVGKKKGKVVLDSRGLEVAHFVHGCENMAKEYVQWVNNLNENE